MVKTPINCHNPYFNRWFSAIYDTDILGNNINLCHNPYFNRWFSAMNLKGMEDSQRGQSQSLF